jgi:hypothetical protein
MSDDLPVDLTRDLIDLTIDEVIDLTTNPVIDLTSPPGGGTLDFEEEISVHVRINTIDVHLIEAVAQCFRYATFLPQPERDEDGLVADWALDIAGVTTHDVLLEIPSILHHEDWNWRYINERRRHSMCDAFCKVAVRFSFTPYSSGYDEGIWSMERVQRFFEPVSRAVLREDRIKHPKPVHACAA